MSYQRAFSSLGCPELSLGDALALAEGHGLAGLELRSLGGSVDLPAYFTKKFGTPEQLRLQVPAGKILALDTSFALVGATPPAREALLQFVPWAEALGVARLRVFDGGKTADAAEVSEAAATYRWWHDLRTQQGWNTDLMIETHDSLFTADAIHRFLAVAPGASILWDSHHTWKKGGEDPVMTWRRIKAHVVHIHVKDSISQPSARHPFTYVLPGEGEFPMAGLRHALHGEYSGIVSLEWEKMWHPYLPALALALKVAAERLWW